MHYGNFLAAVLAALKEVDLNADDAEEITFWQDKASAEVCQLESFLVVTGAAFQAPCNRKRNAAGIWTHICACMQKDIPRLWDVCLF